MNWQRVCLRHSDYRGRPRHQQAEMPRSSGFRAFSAAGEQGLRKASRCGTNTLACLSQDRVQAPLDARSGMSSVSTGKLSVNLFSTIFHKTNHRPCRIITSIFSKAKLPAPPPSGDATPPLPMPLPIPSLQGMDPATTPPRSASSMQCAQQRLQYILSCRGNEKATVNGRASIDRTSRWRRRMSTT